MLQRPKTGDLFSPFLTKPDSLTFSTTALYGLNLGGGVCVCGGRLSGILHPTQEPPEAGVQTITPLWPKEEAQPSRWEAT